ncbi:hypothetical protein BH23GEM9_BH23GEM9_22110 [soil metagenome]
MKQHELMKRYTWFWAAVLSVVTGCTVPAERDAATLPPGTTGDVATSPDPFVAAPRVDPGAIDTVQLIRDLSVLAHDSMEGRLVGTPGSVRAQRFLVRRFTDTGLQRFGTGYTHPFTFTRREQQMQGVNMIGFVRGSARPDRHIVITAHYDHLGIRDGEIFPGADDNASGTAGLIALADYFVRNPPRHSMVFVAFDAEEGGLQGARAFVANPPVAP